MCLIYQNSFAELVAQIRLTLPQLTTLVCLDADTDLAPSLQRWLGDEPDTTYDGTPVDDVAMIVGTGGTTGAPKGVMLTGNNLEP